ncbi:hypothetical protein FHX81_6997 [Saccharothrix saharensis]|uniref:Transposase n=1 Tax=Saccharothrix saharensis TaxID=571190 RepID=A0A543JNX3_9PSEU|nr:hypothetical protein [Saccharothrix saharensis]TQM84542.1 hypothetical protein FHX81_6997 [Saccharothrix saharensis]
MIDYIDRHKQEVEVEQICRVLRQAGVRIARSSYYAAKIRPASARPVRDERLKSDILDVQGQLPLLGSAVSGER